jgi:predicted molibdopterin-dependent oxidoreductase YjgC
MGNSKNSEANDRENVAASFVSIPSDKQPTAHERVHFICDGQDMCARAGDTVAAALLAARKRSLRVTSRRGEPRGLFCGMGVCFDCLVEVDGRPNVRACRTEVISGMQVTTQQGHGAGSRTA